MSGAITELNAIGPQDNFLNVDPEYTPFRGGFKRPSKHVFEMKEIIFNSHPDYGREATVEIPLSGDMLGDCYLKIEPQVLTGSGMYANEFGHKVIEEIKLLIGNTPIITHSDLFLHTYNEALSKYGKKLGRTIGKFNSDMELKSWSQTPNPLRDGYCQPLYVDLRFWFNNHIQQFLPLIALRNHEIKIQIKLRNWRDVVSYVNEKPSLSVSLVANYVLLLDKEREIYSSTSHVYLIEQQKELTPHALNGNQTHDSFTIDLGHPVFQFFWFYRPRDVMVQRDVTLDGVNYTAAPYRYVFMAMERSNNNIKLKEPVKTARFKLNGHDRSDPMDSFYWRDWQYRPRGNVMGSGHEIVPYAREHEISYEGFKTKPSILYDGTGIDSCALEAQSQAIYTWCPALMPRSWKPSNHINLTRIDTKSLETVSMNPISRGNGMEGAGELIMIARFFNVVTIENGMLRQEFAS